MKCHFLWDAWSCCQNYCETGLWDRLWDCALFVDMSLQHIVRRLRKNCETAHKLQTSFHYSEQKIWRFANTVRTPTKVLIAGIYESASCLTMRCVRMRVKHNEFACVVADILQFGIQTSFFDNPFANNFILLWDTGVRIVRQLAASIPRSGQ